MAYKPKTPYATPLILLKPTTTKIQGVNQKSFPAVTDGELFFGSFRSFGGTETTENGIYSVVDTATVETWFRPDIKADCRIALAETGAVYEIVGTPEDIEMRHQYLKVKLRRIGGGA